MSIEFKLDTIIRGEELQGKGASRRLRKENQVPAIIYGGNGEPKAISVKYNQLVRFLQEDAFFSEEITLAFADGEEKVTIKALQRHPAKSIPLHVDFMRV